MPEAPSCPLLPPPHSSPSLGLEYSVGRWMLLKNENTLSQFSKGETEEARGGPDDGPRPPRAVVFRRGVLPCSLLGTPLRWESVLPTGETHCLFYHSSSSPPSLRTPVPGSTRARVPGLALQELRAKWGGGHRWAAYSRQRAECPVGAPLFKQLQSGLSASLFSPGSRHCGGLLFLLPQGTRFFSYLLSFT